MKNPLLIALFSTIVTISSCREEVDHDSEATVYISKTSSGYHLIRNGKNFFIKGTSGNAHFKELKKAGGNTIRIYDTTNLGNTLDLAHDAGLAVILDVPVHRFLIPDTIYSSERIMKDLFEDTKNFILNYKDHPALLYWMLGNELKAPNLPGNDNFYKNYKKLVDLVQELDKNHPVSTAVGGFDRSRVLSIQKKVPNLDLISINIFGELSTFNTRKKLISPIWNGPYVFSEFGINGPWEADQTLWSVPIEQTSTKKAEQYEERYSNYIKTLDDNRFLGSLTFFWGHKQERTHTWFSFFSENGEKTEATFAMENLWKNQTRRFHGPKINYILLNGKGAQESIILNTNEKAFAEILLLSKKKNPNNRLHWEIRPENWNYIQYGKESLPEPLNGLIENPNQTTINFTSPSEDGPYRLFVYVHDETDFFATANIPFYVLNPEDE